MPRRKTVEEFKNDVIKLYGDSYDLSKVNYLGNKIKVTIKCNLCGREFDIRPNDLLSGHGCKCRSCWKYDGKYYKTKFKEIHGNKYDYSLLDDNRKYTQNECIDIICPKHGVFKQRILYHLSGNGCRKCANETCGKNVRLTYNEVIKKLDKLCENNLTYTLDYYKNNRQKIKFKCIKHSHLFYRTLNALTNNNVCPYCNGRKDWSTKTFINKAKEIHGNKYDYSKVEYKTTDDYVTVICHEKDKFGIEHGEFPVTPHAHIGSMRSGCPKCSGKHHYTTEEFIREANYVHNNFYTYEKTIYNGAKINVVITCPVHGDFTQQPNGHLSEQGCPKCKRSHGESDIETLLKDNNIKYITQYRPQWLHTQKTSSQSLDFYLPDYNTAIEIQGYQHYVPVKYWGGEENFIKIKERDKRKKELCEENNVYLLYYSECKQIPNEYTNQVITNKQELLTKILNKNG